MITLQHAQGTTIIDPRTVTGHTVIGHEDGDDAILEIRVTHRISLPTEQAEEEFLNISRLVRSTDNEDG